MALLRGSNVWGLTRHLSEEGIGATLSKSGTTAFLRNHTLVYRDKLDYWVASVMRKEKGLRSGIDQAAYQSLGEMGWKTYLFLRRD